MTEQKKGSQLPHVDFADIWDRVFRGISPKKTQSVQPTQTAQSIPTQPVSTSEIVEQEIDIDLEAISEKNVEVAGLPSEPTLGRILIAEIEKSHKPPLPPRSKKISRKTLSPTEIEEQLNRIYTDIRFYMVAQTIGCSLTRLFPMFNDSIKFEILIIFGKEGKITFRGNAVQTRKTYRLSDFIQSYKAYIREDEIDSLIGICENLGKIPWEETQVRLFPLFCIINRLLLNVMKERYKKLGERLFNQKIIFQEDEER